MQMNTDGVGSILVTRVRERSCAHQDELEEQYHRAERTGIPEGTWLHHHPDLDRRANGDHRG
jgi:hypothetical protein